jgi:hypothetical protein
VSFDYHVCDLRLALITTLRPLLEDGGADIAGYNKEIEQRGNPTWHNVTWLFSECYMYR